MNTTACLLPDDDFPQDYIEIINEINDFVRSLGSVENLAADSGATSSGGTVEASTSSASESYGTTSGGSRLSHESEENDYEDIEIFQSPCSSPPPTPRRVRRTYIKMTDGGPKHVKSLHNFKGSNNDELCFDKGDIITVTQALDGGWWEGTLKGKTGWFPSNYVKEFKSELGHGTGMKSNRNSDVSVIKRESMQLYHNVVLKNVIETERTHVSELTKVLKNYLLPLQGTGILNPGEFCQLIGNLEDIAAFQKIFLASLEECEKLPPSQRRIGGVFMQHAEQLRNLYIQYCSNHPLAVSILQRHREALSRYMETLGVPAPGSMTLTTHLSKAFTRLEKYPSLLKELERHIEESHPDRGDTQRAIAVYRDIANSCMEIRKLKEMEHEIVASNIKDWEGEDITKLGEVIHLSQVKIHTNTGEKHERICILFPHCLVMLSMSPRLSGYQYEAKLPLSGLVVTRCEAGDRYPNGFEISGNMIEPMVITCGTKNEVLTWVDILRQQIKQAINTGSTKPQSLQISQSQPSISTMTPAKTAKVSQTGLMKSNSTWSMSCLRPFPPIRPSLACREDALKSPKAARKSVQSKRKPDDPKVYNEDAFILEVIEAYHNSAKTRHTLTSLDLTKLRLSDGSTSDGSAASDPLISPELDDYNFLRGTHMMQGFCCATFPLARGMAKAMKRL